MIKQTLLVEIGTEELPPKSLKALSQAFADGLAHNLQEAQLSFDRVRPLASARRLAVQVHGLSAEQADVLVEKRGPAVSAAFDGDGQPTKAAQAWASSLGIEVQQADRLVTDKGEWLLYKAMQKGQPLTKILPSLVQQALKQLPIAKPMRWGSSDEQFIRPVHTVTLLYGNTLIEGEILGVASSRQLQGHRFHCPQGTHIAHADDYDAVLEKAYVIADFGQRRQRIIDAVQQLAAQLGGVVAPDEALLDEVTALVEWPVALSASFDAAFLKVPKEPLIVTMKDDQRYFPLQDAQGALLPQFIFISNIESKDPQQVIAGNEKVVRPRLADAQFFFESDQKVSLDQRLTQLSQVLFQKELGSVRDKAMRIAGLAGAIAAAMGGDQAAAERAGLLCKADLATQMVNEFPETQGVMGMHYARLQGEPEAVAVAIYEHYLPRFAGDALPNTLIGAAVAMADKLDSLVGIFGIGQVPKGDRDPFALRRAAIGLLRIIVENGYSVDLEELVALALAQFADKFAPANIAEEVVDFLLGRFRAWYQEQGIAVDVIQSVLARRPTRPLDFDRRVHAVSQFRDLPQADALAAANKRVANLLAKLDGSVVHQVESALLTEPAEIALHESLQQAAHEADQALARDNYTAALTALAALQQPVDAFFEQVMVNADDAQVRRNRQALLAQLQQQFLRIADISVLNS